MNLPPKVTERAFAKLAEINESGQPVPLRVAVLGGGCSGFQYEIRLDDKAEEWMIRSRSRCQGLRKVDMRSGCNRPRLASGWQA